MRSEKKRTREQTSGTDGRTALETNELTLLLKSHHFALDSRKANVTANAKLELLEYIRKHSLSGSKIEKIDAAEVLQGRAGV